jgi:hypothetical protein
VQVDALPHWPLELHVCNPLPEHCVAPGEHTPVQAPITHAEFAHATGLLQVPVEEQVCVPLPEH